MCRNLSLPTVILLDEIGAALQRYPELDDAFWEGLRSLASCSTGGNLAFVLASHSPPIELAHDSGHSSPFFNIFGYTTILGRLTEAEARALIASSPRTRSRARRSLGSWSRAGAGRSCCSSCAGNAWRHWKRARPGPAGRWRGCGR